MVCAGCAQQTHPNDANPSSPPRVLVIAPILNLSGSQDFDPIKLTDLIASEFLSFPGVAVIPVNRTLAELGLRGKAFIETPADAVELASVLGADATIVISVTEYYPYDPPVVGLIMQWYAAGPARADSSGPAGNVPGVTQPLSVADMNAPRWQVQRVFNAADGGVQKQVREYAEHREGGHSPYGWRKYTKSQELYVRYCGWALIQTMLRLDSGSRVAVEAHEAGT